MARQGSEYQQVIKDHLRTSYLLTDEKIEAVLPRFLETIKTLMAELEELAVSEKDSMLSRTGHAMKGALLNLGLHDLAGKAFAIEKHREICDPQRDCMQLVAELKQEINKII